MRRQLLVLLSLMMGVSGSAQDYPQKDAEGQTIYYKIVSAAPDYYGQKLCLQDVSNQVASGKFQYTLTQAEETNKRQDWVLVTADAAKGTYYLRNRMTYRYISLSGEWIGNFMGLTFSTKNTGNAITVTPLQDKQVTLSYQTTNGLRYLGATDITRPASQMPSSMQDTPWAWYIIDADALMTGIDTPEAEQASQVCDLQGRILPPEAIKRPGIYVIKYPAHTRKVYIR